MASAIAISIHELRVNSTFGTSLSRSCILPYWARAVLKFWVLPRALKSITIALSGEALGRLTKQQAFDLYGPLNQFHIELCKVLEANQNTWYSFLISGWLQELSTETEKLGDIVETLAWGSDDELQSLIDSAIGSIQTSM